MNCIMQNVHLDQIISISFIITIIILSFFPQLILISDIYPCAISEVLLWY